MPSKTGSAAEAAAATKFDLEQALIRGLMFASQVRLLKMHGLNQEALAIAGSPENLEELIGFISHFERIMHGGATLITAIDELVRSGWPLRLSRIAEELAAKVSPVTTH